MSETKVSTAKTKELISKPVQEIKPGMSLKSLLATDTVRRRFEQVLGKKAAGFTSSILSAVGINPNLETCDPMSVISSAMIAAALDLPINSSLGFAHLVPYNNKCQMQFGWRGFVQLAQRTGEYKTLNVTEVYEGEIKKSDRFSGIMQFDELGKKSDKVIGYVAYLQMLNGFEKWFYMSKEQAETHGRRYSKSYDSGQWKKDFDAMAKKTVIKMLLSKWGMMSVDIQKAVDYDQAVVGQNDKPEYIDVPEEAPVLKPAQNIGSLVSEEQQQELLDLCKKHDVKLEHFLSFLKTRYNVDAITLIKKADYEYITHWIAGDIV